MSNLSPTAQWIARHDTPETLENLARQLEALMTAAQRARDELNGRANNVWFVDHDIYARLVNNLDTVLAMFPLSRAEETPDA